MTSGLKILWEFVSQLWSPVADDGLDWDDITALPGLPRSLNNHPEH